MYNMAMAELLSPWTPLRGPGCPIPIVGGPNW